MDGAIPAFLKEICQSELGFYAALLLSQNLERLISHLGFREGDRCAAAPLHPYHRGFRVYVEVLGFIHGIP